MTTSMKLANRLLNEFQDQRVIGKRFYRTPIFKHIVVSNITLSAGNTTVVFNFPYHSRFPSLLAGNKTTVFDAAYYFPGIPSHTLAYTGNTTTVVTSPALSPAIFSLFICHPFPFPVAPR